jgi:hypothetical protein
MPFITQDRRTAINEHGLGVLAEILPGDICYAFYKPMVDAWKANPRWTTAHYIYKEMVYYLEEDPDKFAAYSLAWQVFFQLYVMPYEYQKRAENGDI